MKKKLKKSKIRLRLDKKEYKKTEKKEKKRKIIEQKLN